jgi:hypothetical protein
MMGFQADLITFNTLISAATWLRPFLVCCCESTIGEERGTQ